MKTRSDEEKFALIRQKLYTPVVSDTLDSLGFRHQAMRHDIRPLHPDFVVVGRARTLLWMSTCAEVKPNPYVNEIKAIDALVPGDVTVHSTDHSWTVAPWGELLSTASRMRGSTGAIVDALVRDVKRIIAMDFPTFARGIKPVDSRGRGFAADFDITIQCGEVEVHPGEIVFGDYDGIVVIPKEAEEETLARALAKVEGENNTRMELLQGRLLGDVYKKYGVL
ncbi:MAG: RraA family protein [Chloroflexota bacterium]|nr:RraA family protein [Chloroflexota bacterium]